MTRIHKNIAACILLSIAAPLTAQLRHITLRPPAENVIIPQSRARGFTHDRTDAIEITEINARIDILESTATTTIEIRLTNTTSRRQEAELIVPVCEGAVVRGFAYDGPGGEITAEVLAKDEAKRIYQQLVAKIRDPALVELIGYNLIRSSVFPVEPRGKQKVRLTYEHLLQVDGNRIDYILHQNRRTVHIESPYDTEITELNLKLNDTYIPYGRAGKLARENQVTQDNNAAAASPSAALGRAASKSSHNYRNQSWDLVDALEQNTVKLEEIESRELPEQMQKMTNEERTAYVDAKAGERNEIQQRIQDLTQQRKKFVAEEIKKRQGGVDTLGSAIIQAVRRQAEKKNFNFEPPEPTAEKDN